MDLKRQLEQKTAQLAALREIGRAINAAWDLKDTLELITRKTAEVMGMDSCSIYLLDPDGEHLVLEATTGLAPEAVGRARLRLGEGLTGWAAQQGEPVGVADAARDPRFKYLPETRETRFQSLLAVPLINQGRVIGAMNVQTRAYHEFGAEEVELLSLIGDLAAGALEKAMLYERMQRQIAELSTLAEVSRTITSPLYLDQMLGLIVDMAARVMRAKVCSLMLLDETENVLILRATQGLSPAYRDRPPLKVGEGIAGRVAETGEPIVVADVRTDPRYRYPEVAREVGLCSLLCVPLRVRDRTIGVFNCYTGEPHTFTPQEIGLFQTLANQTALAIENARLVVNTAVVREMHHRVKNNLQTVAMLLRLQMTEGDLDPRQALQESINRVLSIAAVHEVLSEKGFRLVDLRRVLRQVVQTVVQNRPHPDKDIQVKVDGDEIALPSRSATALALAVNELVQNSLKHAFVGRETGCIEVSLHRRPSGYEVVVADDGVGLPPGAPPPRSLGLQIVETLVTQDLGGELRFEYGPQGTRAVITVEEVA
ncbi:MAG TPA: GAF domain-containing protein [Thermoflexia bacterium]|jgi:signal transduction protein with GAF and PtsI domain|nr:GAF domain-containing protein [Thermoflexia bacterium]